MATAHPVRPLTEPARRRRLLGQLVLAFGLIVFGLPAVASLRAAELEPGTATASNLRLPIFAPDGRLIRRLTADSGHGQKDGMQLSRGQLDFFTFTAGTIPAATMKFEQADYDPLKQIVSSDTPVRFESKEGAVLSGRGYRYVHGENHLTLRSEVTGDFEGAHLGAPNAEIVFNPDKPDTLAVINEIVFPQGATLTGPAVEARGVERLQVTKLRYEAATEMVYPVGPITGWVKGEPRTLSGDDMGFRLPPLPALRK